MLTTDVAGQTINLVLESTTETTSDIFKTFAQFTTDNTSNALSKGFGQIEEFIAPDELDGPISYVREGVLRSCRISLGIQYLHWNIQLPRKLGFRHRNFFR